MRKKYYVGLGRDWKRTIFLCASEPTERSHGHLYFATIGPFHTKLAAEITAKHGAGNPHIQHVLDAERFARLGRVELRKRGFRV